MKNTRFGTAFRTGLLLATTMLVSPAFAAEEKPAATPAPAAAPAAPVKDYTILKLGTEEVKYSEIMDIWKSLFPGGAAPDFSTFDENIRQNVLRGIVSERLIHKEALKAGTDKSAEVKKRLDALQKQVVMQTFMEDKAKTMVTDAQLKAAYDEKVAATKDVEEVKARHILVAKEEEAKKIVEQLNKKGDFEKIAKEKSTDTGSGKQGGDLGWFTKDKMVPEFAEAAFALKKGEVSKPVKSPFGWHVIKLEDRRAVKPASFEESKDALKGELTNKAVQGYVEGLLKTADIKYFDADGKEKEFPRTAPAPKPAPDAAAAATPAKADDKKPEEKQQ
jgi:peptidyl-prolyl cis-trans isomerase C